MLDVAIRRALPDFTLDASFRLEGPGVAALYGRSGAGKSTLILALAGLSPAARGRVVLNGRTLLDSAAGVSVPARARRVGVVFQDARLFPHRTVRGNLLYGAKRAGDRADAASFDHVVALLGLDHLLGRRPITLSGGEKQRVALGRALLAAPDLLLLDEPLAALDAARKAEILPYLERLRDEARIPIIYVSHSVDEIARLADRVVALDRGKVIADGPVDSVFATLGLHGGDGSEATAIVAARVLRPDAGDGLADLELLKDGHGAALTVPALRAAAGDTVRLQIRARDVTVALDAPGRVSANNVLPVRIATIAESGASALLLLECGGQTLAAHITGRALRRLGLAEGMDAYAIIKTVTIAR